MPLDMLIHGNPIHNKGQVHPDSAVQFTITLSFENWAHVCNKLITAPHVNPGSTAEQFALTIERELKLINPEFEPS